MALDVGLVFVLGHTEYYQRAGFRPALPLGLRPPYDIDPAVADAWMVRATRPGLLGAVLGTVRCANALMHPELWREWVLLRGSWKRGTPHTDIEVKEDRVRDLRLTGPSPIVSWKASQRPRLHCRGHR